jgi:hypothetical protein
MSKEHLYIADSGIDPSPITPAQEAFFRWRYTAGRLDYAESHGSKDEARALLQETTERYDAYTALRDGRQDPAPLPLAESPHDAASGRFVAERPALGLDAYASRAGRGARVQAHDQELLENVETARALRESGLIAYNVVAGGSPDLDETRQPLQPNELPPEMADFLRDKEYACLLWSTEQGSVFVVKAHQRDIQSLRGNVPVHVRHELYDHPQAPVIRTVVRWYDQPESPLALESYTNVGDPQQRADFVDLAERDELRFLFYDQTLSHRLTKQVPNTDRETISRITITAAELAAHVPAEQLDFDAAKADIISHTSL